MGQSSIAVDAPALSRDAAVGLGDDLVDAVLTLQRGAPYLRSSWPVDALLRLYLTNAALDSLQFSPEEVWLEVRGARGRFHVNRLDAGTFIFRQLLQAGRPIGEAADRTLMRASSIETGEGAVFESGAALAALFADSLVTYLDHPDGARHD